MKKSFYFVLILILPLSSLWAQENQVIPQLNQEILNYLKSVIGKKVDRGECWDLANQALIKTNAKWKFPNEFGKVVKPEIDTIYPGDLIQFTNVKIKSSKNETWTFPKHTAIVYEVIGIGVYKIAEQNVNGKRKVQIDDLDLHEKISGKIVFYRPVK